MQPSTKFAPTSCWSSLPHNSCCISHSDMPHMALACVTLFPGPMRCHLHGQPRNDHLRARGGVVGRVAEAHRHEHKGGSLQVGRQLQASSALQDRLRLAQTLGQKVVPRQKSSIQRPHSLLSACERIWSASNLPRHKGRLGTQPGVLCYQTMATAVAENHHQYVCDGKQDRAPHN
jgi:hypothetical protein